MDAVLHHATRAGSRRQAFTSAGLLQIRIRIKEKASGLSQGARWPYFKELGGIVSGGILP